LVVVYHLWPGVLTGGYVGVDIFFVISGFLITGGLVARPPGTWRDVADFWGRRIRRLLPASFLVIIATGVAAWLVGPPSAWVQTARDAVAAAVYAENWNLWQQSADYLGRGGTPSIFQHFWSLSVEEQFYVFWPVMILAVAAVWRRAQKRSSGISVRRPVAWAVGAVATVSFGLSVWMTARDQAEAYLVTQTRMWELALGGLLACFWPWLESRLGRRPGVRAGMVAVGLAAMVAAAVGFTDATAFPGWVGLLPTVGAALFIAGGRNRTTSPAQGRAPVAGDVAATGRAEAGATPDTRGGAAPNPNLAGRTVTGDGVDGIDGLLNRFWSFRPIQYLGDMSYSVYLWHWPLILLAPNVLGRNLTVGTSLLVVLGTLGISAASYELVEKPFQRSRWMRARLRRTFVPAVAGMAAISVAGAVLYITVPAAIKRSIAADREHVRESPCMGAQRILDPGCASGQPDEETGPYPNPRFAWFDHSPAYDNGCTRHWTNPTPAKCRYGLLEGSGGNEVVLWGNSHAVQWLPGLERIADELQLGITTRLSSSCFPRAPGSRFDPLTESSPCVDVTSQELDAIRASRPDLVVVTNRASSPPQLHELAVESARWVLEQLTDAQIKVLLIRDIPREPSNRSIPDCLAANGGQPDRCAGPQESWIFPDPWADAAAEMGSDLIEVVDFNNAICDGEVCTGLVGSVVAYFDDDHLSITFVETLAPQLSAAIEGALAR
jgi:peptidoglycan/LPS O-acetylase OafA/YrhL